MEIEIKDFYGKKKKWNLSNYETSKDGLLRFIRELMIEYGPDGHCDGAEQIMDGTIKFLNKKFDIK